MDLISSCFKTGQLILELVEVDLAVGRVDLEEDLFGVRARAHDDDEVVNGDVAFVVRVYRLEDFLQPIVADRLVAREHGGGELVVVDDVVVVGVEALDEGGHLVFCRRMTVLLQSAPQLCKRYLARVVRIHLRPDLRQLGDLPLREVVRQHVERRLLQAREADELSEARRQGVAREPRRVGPLGRVRVQRLCDPGVFQGLVGRETVCGVEAEEVLDEAEAGAGDGGPVVFGERLGREPGTDAAEDFGVAVAVKGRVATEEDVGDAADGPQVAGKRVVALQHLGRNVVRRAHERVHDALAGLLRRREAKVDDLEHGVGSWRLEKEVLRLQVSVANAVAVAVRHRLQDLLHDARRVVLAVVALFRSRLLDDGVKELAAAAELRHDEDVVRVLKDVVDSDDVRVLHRLEDVDLARKRLGVGDALLRNRLAGADFLGRSVRALAHDAEMAAADDVLVERVHRFEALRLRQPHRALLATHRAVHLARRRRGAGTAPRRPGTHPARPPPPAPSNAHRLFD
mmetsp:Transcript_24368/g.82161  ORF Transcript_24368/g.82161 Transcript_24368/m.82161 type:complete len:514 (+) Transcript_24368:1409-2950(+)